MGQNSLLWISITVTEVVFLEYLVFVTNFEIQTKSTKDFFFTASRNTLQEKIKERSIISKI